MFGAPLWLLGTLAGGAPTIIHFLNRQRFKRVSWAAMEWSLKALERNRRRMRVENLILLIVRVLILLLLALALARPILEATGALSMAGGARICRIIVIDNSYSMGVSIAGTTPLDRAEKAAGDILRTAAGGDLGSVIVGGDAAEVVPDPISDSALVRDQVETIELSHGEVNLPAILTKVAALADRLTQPRIRVYVFTDMQRHSWVSAGAIRDDELAEQLKKLGKKAGIFLIDCMGKEMPNTVVKNVLVSADETGEGQGLVSLDTPVSVRATIEHLAPEARGEVGVRMLIDGRLEGRKTVTLDSRKPAIAQFSGVTFDKPGPHVIRVEVDGDALSLDDGRDLAVGVEREVRTLCVNGSPSADLVSNETYFLERALAPQQFEFGGALSVFSVDTVGDLDFLTRNLNDYRLIVLANVFQVPPEKLTQLEAFVRRGGGLIIFAGDRVESKAYNDLLYAKGTGLLPAQILERKSFGAGPDPFSRFDVRHADHEIIRMLKDRNVDVSVARVREYFYLEAEEGSEDVRVLFRYDNPGATPAAVERTFGQGTVVLVSTSATTAWSTFPVTPAFLPFMQELAAYASRGSGGRRNLLVGEPIRMVLFPGEFGMKVSVLTPEKESMDHQPAPEGDAYRFDFADTRTAGVYAVDFGGTRGRTDYCVTLDTRESDLERIKPAELDRLVPGNPFYHVAGTEALHAAVSKAEIGASVWKPLIYCVLALLLVEALMAKVFGSKRGTVKRN